MNKITIQDQYKGTNIETLFNGLTALYDKLINEPIIDFYSNIYNLDTAKGIGLDIWGERLDFPRVIKYTDTETDEEEIVVLSDDEYRLFLNTITLKFYTKLTTPGINSGLQELFSLYNIKAYTVDYQNMTFVNYIFVWEIADYIKQAFSSYNLLPHPMAIGVQVTEGNYQIFGFKGQELSDNFYRTIFYGGNE